MKTGLPPNPPPGAAPRPGYDPATTTLHQCKEAKAAELEESLRTAQLRRACYARQGLRGLVDQHAARGNAATGRVDARLVAALREVIEAEIDTATGTRSRLIRRAIKAVEEAHGPGWCRC